jgi:uncharacterized surface protein with fasciclin (FAS1) repeats
MTTPQAPIPPSSDALALLPENLAAGNLAAIDAQLKAGELSMLQQHLTGQQMSDFSAAVQAGDAEAARAAVAGVEIPGVGELAPKKRSPWPIVAIVVAILVVVGVIAVVLLSGDDLKTIPDTLADDSDYSTVTELIETAGLTDQLSESGPFTMFAPDNAAFEAMPGDEFDLLKSDALKARQLLLYHVTTGELKADDLPPSIPTQEGSDLTVEGSGSSLTVNGASIVKPDVEASNGLIQGIDQVLIPPGMDLTAAPTQNIVELLSSNPNYSTLASLIVSAGLSDTLSSAGPFTVFAPQNTAFAALTDEQNAALQNDPNALRQVLNYHVVAGDMKADDLSTGSLNSVEGSPLSVVVSGDSVKVNDAEVVDPNLLASNGVAHGIDAVLIPPGVDLTTTTTEGPTTAAPPTGVPTTAAPTTGAPTTLTPTTAP